MVFDCQKHKVDPQDGICHLCGTVDGLAAPIDPIKVCCGKRLSEHNGPQCPDGLVMCCLCFRRFTVNDLSVDPEDDKKTDVCLDCAEMEKKANG